MASLKGKNFGQKLQFFSPSDKKMVISPLLFHSNCGGNPADILQIFLFVPRNCANKIEAKHWKFFNVSKVNIEKEMKDREEIYQKQVKYP